MNINVTRIDRSSNGMVQFYNGADVVDSFSITSSVSIGFENNTPKTIVFSNSVKTLSFDIFNLTALYGATSSKIFSAVLDPSSTSSAYKDRLYDTYGFLVSDMVAGCCPSITPAALTRTNDTNVTITLGGTPGSALLQAVSITLGWTGTLADSRIASATTWNAKQNAITLTTTGTSGAATLVGSTLNGPQYTASSSTIYVFNMNSFAVPNGSLFYGIYLGGTPVSPATVSTQYGGAATDFFPGYPMPVGAASTLVVILRIAQVAPTSAMTIKLANTSTSTFGPIITIAAGSAAGTYTDNSATVSFTANQRLSIVASNPTVSGATAGPQLTTGSFKYTI